MVEAMEDDLDTDAVKAALLVHLLTPLHLVFERALQNHKEAVIMARNLT